TTTTAGTGPQLTGLSVGDFNADSKPDIAYTDVGDNKIHVLTNTAAGGVLSFTETKYGPPTMPSNCNNNSGQVLAIAASNDVNNDGYVDLVVLAGCFLN